MQQLQGAGNAETSVHERNVVLLYAHLVDGVHVRLAGEGVVRPIGFRNDPSIRIFQLIAQKPQPVLLHHAIDRRTLLHDLAPHRVVINHPHLLGCQ
eukprot:2730430-Pyramimonas_sp.AAC.1